MGNDSASSSVTTPILGDEQQPVHIELQTLRIVVLEGPDKGAEIRPARPVALVGTDEKALVRLTDSTVSRQHCELLVGASAIRVRDLGSSNGTFVDGHRVVEIDVRPGTLLSIGKTTLRLSVSDDVIQVPLSSSDRFGALIGRSVKMREVFAILERVSATETTVLIEGESGTGKELAAEGIHAQSSRADGPFVVFDASAVPRDLAESVLFGHVRGAFTGAVADRPGVFEDAHGGTLFIDELGELPIDLQPKLLRVLEKREIKRLGSNKAKPVDVRIVAATNRCLETEVNAGRFRADLFYRVGVVKVVLPPLRQRTEDIPLLVEHFVRQIAPQEAERLSQRTIAALVAQPWQGNVRELRNAVERALSLMGAGAFAPSGQTNPQGILSEPIHVDAPYYEARERLLEAFHRSYWKAALDKSGGNISEAARTAGVNRKVVQRMIRQFGWKMSEPRDD